MRWVGFKPTASRYGIPGYSRIVSIVSQANANWRKVSESNAHPEGAPVFKAGRLTISSTFQNREKKLSPTYLPGGPNCGP